MYFFTFGLQDVPPSPGLSASGSSLLRARSRVKHCRLRRSDLPLRLVQKPRSLSAASSAVGRSSSLGRRRSTLRRWRALATHTGIPSTSASRGRWRISDTHTTASTGVASPAARRVAAAMATACRSGRPGSVRPPTTTRPSPFTRTRPAPSFTSTAAAIGPSTTMSTSPPTPGNRALKRIASARTRPRRAPREPRHARRRRHALPGH